MYSSRIFRRGGSFFSTLLMGVVLLWPGCREEEKLDPAILIEVTLAEDAMSLDGNLDVLHFKVAYPAEDQKDDVAEPLYVTDSEITGTEVNISGRSLADSPFRLLIRRNPDMKADSIKVFVLGYAGSNKAAYGVLSSPPFQRFFEDEIVSRSIKLERIYEGAHPFEVTKHGCVIDSGSKILMASPVDRDCDGYTVEEGDCDDNDPTVNPGVIDDVCDGKDSSCGNVNNVHGKTEDCYVVLTGQGNEPLSGCYKGVRVCDDMNGEGWSDCEVNHDALPVSNAVCDQYLECLEMFPEDPLLCMEQTEPPRDIECYVYLDSQIADNVLCADVPSHTLPDHDDAGVCKWTLYRQHMGTDDWEIYLTTEVEDTEPRDEIDLCTGVSLSAVPLESAGNTVSAQVGLKFVKDGAIRQYNVNITIKAGNCADVIEGMYCNPDFPF